MPTDSLYYTPNGSIMSPVMTFVDWLESYGAEWLSLHASVACARACARTRVATDLFVGHALSFLQGNTTAKFKRSLKPISEYRNEPDILAHIVNYMWSPPDDTLLKLIYQNRRGFARWPCEKQRVCASLLPVPGPLPRTGASSPRPLYLTECLLIGPKENAA